MTTPSLIRCLSKRVPKQAVAAQRFFSEHTIRRKEPADHPFPGYEYKVLPGEKAPRNRGITHYEASLDGDLNPIPEPVKPRGSITELHAKAILMNRDKQKDEEMQWVRQRNVPGVVVPEAIKLHPADSIEVKKWKYRQQQRYEIEDKFDYALSHLVKLGIFSEADVERRRTDMQSLRDWKRPLAGREISMNKMESIQAEFLDKELHIQEDDSPEEKKRKAEEQLETYITRAQEKLNTLGDPLAKAQEAIQTRKDLRNEDDDEEELRYMEKQDELKNYELPEDLKTMEDFNKHIVKLRREIEAQGAAKATEVVGAEPLAELGLVRHHALQDLEVELRKAQELEVKYTDEFEARFSKIPESHTGHGLTTVSSFDETMKNNVELNDWVHLKDLDYSKFEKPPTDFEVQIMDKFRQKKQRQWASDNSITLHKRVPVPSGPFDMGPLTRGLHMFRLHAIKQYIWEEKERKRMKDKYAYRDLEDLQLVMDDPDMPWKNEIFEEHKLAVKNNYYWTTEQKEQYIIKLHAFLRSDVFSKEYIDSGTI